MFVQYSYSPTSVVLKPYTYMHNWNRQMSSGNYFKHNLSNVCSVGAGRSQAGYLLTLLLWVSLLDWL